jgi:hypothetical protein
MICSTAKTVALSQMDCCTNRQKRRGHRWRGDGGGNRQAYPPETAGLCFRHVLYVALHLGHLLRADAQVAVGVKVCKQRRLVAGVLGVDHPYATTNPGSTARGQLSSHAAETKHRATARCTVRTLSHERGRIPEVVAVGVIVGVLQAVVGGGDFVAAAGCRCRRAYEGLEAGLQLDGGGGAVAGRRSGSLLGVAADRGSVLGGGRCARRRGREEGDQLLREGHLESEGGGALSGTLRLCRCRHG